MCRYLDFSKLPIDISNKLFNSLLLPILLYGSDVWRCYDKDDLNTWEKDVVEKTHIFLCKYTLGVNKRCPNAAARNDLGRPPLKSLTEISCINFWLHLNNLPSKNIAKQCLQLSKEMAEKNQLGLMQKIKFLYNKSNLTLQTLNNTNEKAFTSHIKQYLRRALADHQLTLLKTNRKLTFYSSFKNDTKKATFLDMIKNPQHRIAITKLRLGNHHLHIIILKQAGTVSQRPLKI